MTKSLPPNKSMKWLRALFIGLLSALIVAIAVYLTLYLSPRRHEVIMFFYSLTQRIDIGDAGVLPGEPCSAPCVFGIQAGETQFDEVPLLLEKYSVSKCETEPNISWVAIHCGFGRFNVQASTQTNLVNGIWFYPNDLISLGEIIGRYGEPDYVSLSREGSPNNPTIQMSISWDSIKMSVAMPRIDGDAYVVENTTDAEGVDFSDELLYQDSSEIEFNSFYKLWNGYGTYQP